jgi:uncharacterized membrane protein YfcA
MQTIGSSPNGGARSGAGARFLEWLLALLAYARAGRVDWLVGLPLALGGIAAISAGVAFASRLPERRIRLAFCGMLLLTAVLLALRG